MPKEAASQKPDFYYVPTMSFDGMLFYVQVVPVPKNPPAPQYEVRGDSFGYSALDDALPRNHMDVEEYVL